MKKAWVAPCHTAPREREADSSWFSANRLLETRVNEAAISLHSGALLKDVITPPNVTPWLCYLQLNYIIMTSLLNPNSPNYSLEIYYLIL